MIDVNDLDGLLELASDYVDDGLHFLTEPVSYGELKLLAERLISAEKDAARYRWLRDVACHSEWHTVGSADPSVWDVIVDEYIDEDMRCNK